jgi:hypothetical protein
MSVRSEVVKETLVETICGRVLARLKDDPPPAVAGVLDGAPDVARMGYLARVVESELFQPARSPMPGLAESLRARLDGGSTWPEAAAAVARELAAREPLERPTPDDPDAVSWRVPGPGGHVRHYVARRLIEGRDAVAERTAAPQRDAALKRDFVYGFLVRCCEEVLSPW